MQVRIGEGVVFGDRVVEQDAKEATIHDIRIGIDLLVIGFHDHSGRLREHVERSRLAECADLLANGWSRLATEGVPFFTTICS
jgi:predicted metal-dependent hydrolase